MTTGPGAGSRGPAEILFAAAIVVVLAGVVLAPLPSYASEARLLPLTVGVPTLVLALVNLAAQLRRAGAGRAAPVSEQADRRARPAVAIAWVLGAAVAVALVGLLFGSLLFMPTFMYAYARERPLRILLVTSGFVGALYLFIRLLEVPYYRGLLLS
jgi:hypothetical protein